MSVLLSSLVLPLPLPLPHRISPTVQLLSSVILTPLYFIAVASVVFLVCCYRASFFFLFFRSSFFVFFISFPFATLLFFSFILFFLFSLFSLSRWLTAFIAALFSTSGLACTVCTTCVVLLALSLFYFFVLYTTQHCSVFFLYPDQFLSFCQVFLYRHSANTCCMLFLLLNALACRPLSRVFVTRVTRVTLATLVALVALVTLVSPCYFLAAAFSNLQFVFAVRVCSSGL